MADIIAAHFDSVDQANRALAALEANGFMRSQMSTFHVSAVTANGSISIRASRRSDRQVPALSTTRTRP